jgi:hypothetical protein
MNKAKTGNTIFDRMVNQITTAAHQAASVPESSPSSSSGGESSRLGQLMKLSGMSSLSSSTSTKEKKLEDLQSTVEKWEGELDLGTAEKMLKWHAEAIGRMVELSSAGDVPKNTFALLKVLADSFGKAYLETALDTYVHFLALPCIWLGYEN